jgi:predicted NAD-dependent protein-ADP-ribosyltransferase YbiA (DUF1768 family)
MLCREALTFVAGNPLRFGDPRSIEAVRLVGLYTECAQLARELCDSPIERLRVLSKLRNGDQVTLKAYLEDFDDPLEVKEALCAT